MSQAMGARGAAKAGSRRWEAVEGLSSQGFEGGVGGVALSAGFAQLAQAGLMAEGGVVFGVAVGGGGAPGGQGRGGSVPRMLGRGGEGTGGHGGEGRACR